MGLLDTVHVCKHCKKGVKVGFNGKCPECGSDVIGASDAKAAEKGLCLLPSVWKSMSEEAKEEFVTKALAYDNKNSETEEKWQYDKYITTTDTFTNGEIEEYLGVVSGTNIYLVGGAIGGGLVSQEDLIAKSLLKAKKAMMGKALDLGGNAIVDMSFAITSAGNTNSLIFVTTGTAVKVKFNEK